MKFIVGLAAGIAIGAAGAIAYAAQSGTDLREVGKRLMSQAGSLSGEDVSGNAAAVWEDTSGNAAAVWEDTSSSVAAAAQDAGESVAAAAEDASAPVGAAAEA